MRLKESKGVGRVLERFKPTLHVHCSMRQPVKRYLCPGNCTASNTCGLGGLFRSPQHGFLFFTYKAAGTLFPLHGREKAVRPPYFPPWGKLL